MTIFMTYFDGGPGVPVDPTDLAIDGSVTPARYRFTNPIPQDSIIRGVVGQYSMSGEFRSDRFASLNAPLANGIQVHLLDSNGNIAADRLGGRPVKTNADWGYFTEDVVGVYSGIGPTIQRMSFPRRTYAPFLAKGWSLQITIRDDLTPLDFFRVFVELDFNDR